MTGAVTTLSVKRAQKPSGKPKRAKGPDGKPKGPPPPQSKPSSKKNKARAAALKAAKSVKGKQGGGAAPHRKPD